MFCYDIFCTQAKLQQFAYGNVRQAPPQSRGDLQDWWIPGWHVAMLLDNLHDSGSD